MKKYFHMVFELVALIIVYVAAIGILMHYLYFISF